MIIDSFLKAVEQLFDKSFRRVFIFGVLGAALALAGLLFALVELTPESIEYFDWEWLNELFSWLLSWSFGPVFLFAAYFLFPAISTMVMGLFLDDIVDAVEAKHYPHDVSPRRLGAYENFMVALRLGGMLIVFNLLAVPFYVLLLFTGVGPFILYLLLNSYLLGREYFDLVSLRHYPSSVAKQVRRANRDKAFLTGGVITGIFVVPILNLFAPLIGAAMMVHIFHHSKHK